MAYPEYVTKCIDYVGEVAFKDMEKSKILASITTAQAILESSYLRSELAVNAKNIFGIKVTKDWTGEVYEKLDLEQINGTPTYVMSKFRKYNSWSESIEDHSNYLLTRKLDGKTLTYKKVIGETNYKKVAQYLQDAGYSTWNTYSSQLSELIERYDLTEFDTCRRPELPSGSRKYYRINDGITTLTDEISKKNIKRIQRFLNRYYGANLEVNGKYTTAVSNAVKTLQKKHNFKDVNGKWGNLCDKIYSQVMGL